MARGRNAEVGAWPPSVVITFAAANAESLFMTVSLCVRFIYRVRRKSVNTQGEDKSFNTQGEA
jgi:hypothetical protein